tara:strand:+ start:118 stop:393 length:276 start_codon:yes stop_codon:yes gene_type:complete
MGFKMKGSPMHRNFDIGNSPLTRDENLPEEEQTSINQEIQDVLKELEEKELAYRKANPQIVPGGSRQTNLDERTWPTIEDARQIVMARRNK